MTMTSQKTDFNLVKFLNNDREKVYQREKDRYISARRFIDYISPILEELPSVNDDVQCFPHLQVTYTGVHLSVSYATSSDEYSNTVRSAVQKILNIPAGREVGYGGNISWVFSKTYSDPSPSGDHPEENSLNNRFGDLKIIINHGRLAPGCEIVEEEKIIKEFKIVCSEGEGNEG